MHKLFLTELKMHFGRGTIIYPKRKAVLLLYVDKTMNVPSKVYYSGTFFYRGNIVTGNINLTEFLKLNKIKVFKEGDTRIRFGNKNGNIPLDAGNSVDWIYEGTLSKTPQKGLKSYKFKDVFLYESEGVGVRVV